MKEHRSISNDKLVNLEDGLIPNGETSYVKRVVKSTNYCKQLVQCIKFLLYLELLLFAGWACYTVWQTYRAESMEVKVTDNIRDSESHIPLAQKLPNEEATAIPNDFLTKMEDLLQTENTLEKTLKHLEEQPDDDETDINFIKTTEEPDSEMKKIEENDIKASSLVETNVPEVMEVEVEKHLEDNESEESNSDPSKSEETVLVWNFGFLPFPNTYHIKEQSPENTDSMEGSIEIENFRERTDSDQIIAALTDHMLLSLILQEALRDAQISDNSKEDTDPKIQDSMFSQSAEVYEDSESFATQSQTKSDNQDWKDDSNVYDDIIINRSTPEGTNEKAIGDFMKQYQDSNMGFEGDFIHQNPIKDYELWTPGTDEILDSSELTGAELSWARSIDKRSIPDVIMNQGLTNMHVEDVEEFDERLVPQLLMEENQNNVMSRLEQKTTETTNNRKFKE